jgi:hypothetical protein
MPLRPGYYDQRETCLIRITNLTLLISVHRRGEVTMPCRNIRNLRKGRETALEKNTRPKKAGMNANAYLTHRMTKSWNGVARWTKALRFS